MLSRRILVTTNGPSARELILKGSAELRSDDPATAIETLDLAVALEPSSPQPYRVRAEVYRRLGMDEKAAADEAKIAQLERQKSFKPGYLLVQEQRARAESNNSLFSFDGHLGRFEYFQHWLYSSGIIIAGTLAGVFLSLLGSFGALIGILLIIGTIIAGWSIVLAASSKRLRDLDKNDGMALLMFVPIVSFILWIYLLSAKSRA